MNPFSQWASAAPPEVDAGEACEMVRAHFGRDAELSPLYGERDRNYRVDFAPAGEPSGPAMLRIHHQDADPAAVRLQHRALVHIAARDPEVPVPRPIATVDGEAILHWASAAGNRHMVRMTTWLDGEPIDLARAPAATRSHMGGVLARLGRALHGCSAEGAPRDLAWDLTQVGRLAEFAGTLPAADLAASVRRRLARFESELAPALAVCRRQVIHNDFNEGNVLFRAGRVSGVIDFGDLVEAPLVCDLAIACAYQLRSEDPVEDLAPFVRGYHQVTPLQDREIELLLPLVGCRVMATLLIQGHRAVAEGDSVRRSAEYSAWAAGRLRCLDAVDDAAAVRRLREACR